MRTQAEDKIAPPIFARFATGYKTVFIARFPRLGTRAVLGCRGMTSSHIRLVLSTILLAGQFGSAVNAQSAATPLQLKPHHATAAVVDLDRAIRWYEQMLGCHVVNRGERPNGTRFADLQLPGFGIGLVQNPGQPPSTPPARSGWIHIVFSVADPPAAYAALKARGADVLVRGNPPPAQIATFLVHDSEGNEIEIVKE